ncbi:MAG: hypothetical protein HC897_02800 [Thermoanaerobaculia bacterium]|nr:hypothetical protein [Thermoanaerobaculia bacterium]
MLFMRYLVFCIYLLFLLATAVRDFAAERHVLTQTACASCTGSSIYSMIQETADFKDRSDDTRRIIFFRVERVDEPMVDARHVVWQNETMYYPSAPPWPFWLSSLVCDPNSHGVYVILAYNRSIVQVALDLYFLPATEPPIPVKSLNSPTDAPYVPKLKHESLASYVGMLPVDGDGLKSIEAMLDAGTLKITLSLVNQRFKPIRFDIDLETKEIRRVEKPSPGGDTPP